MVAVSCRHGFRTSGGEPRIKRKLLQLPRTGCSLGMASLWLSIRRLGLHLATQSLQEAPLLLSQLRLHRMASQPRAFTLSSRRPQLSALYRSTLHFSRWHVMNSLDPEAMVQKSHVSLMIHPMLVRREAQANARSQK